jgi:hypothetical protein
MAKTARTATYRVVGSRSELLGLKRAIVRVCPEGVAVALKERPQRSRSPLGQEPLWVIVIAAVVTGTAQAVVETAIAAFKERRAARASTTARAPRLTRRSQKKQRR